MTEIARSIPLRFARRVAIAAGIAASALTTTPLAAQTTPQAASFEAARQRLEIGGPVFGFIDFEDEVIRLGRDLTRIVADIVGNDPELDTVTFTWYVRRQTGPGTWTPYQATTPATGASAG